MTTKSNKGKILTLGIFTLIIASISVLMFNSNVLAKKCEAGKNVFKQISNSFQNFDSNSDSNNKDILSRSNEELSSSDVDAILFMKEEEKLARDVYITFSENYSNPIFSNISKSEQQHMNEIDILIEKYSLKDPVNNNSIGVFTNNNLSNLYSNLVNKGLENEIEALKIGATIEDLDIKDLNEKINSSNNQDLIQIFESLKKGSYNHLKAFVSNLESKNENYSPQYISTEEFNSIIDSSNISGQGNNNQQSGNQNKRQGRN